MIERQFTDDGLAALYDAFCPPPTQRPSWDRVQVSWGALRFLDVEALPAFLSGAGLVIEEQYGDWARPPLSDTSPEIITIARKG